MDRFAEQPSRVLLPGGHRLNAVLRSGGAGTPVVFLNSLAADLSMWSEVEPAISGRTTLLCDARGHGGSEVVPGDCTVADLGRDVLALMDARGIDRAILCGLSLGGITAMWIAGHAPERVAGLVLANTAVSFPPPQMWRDRAEVARREGVASLVEPTMGRWLTENYRQGRPESAEAVRAMIAATPAEGYAACCGALAEADMSEALAAYRGPVLLVAGRHDQSTPVARAEEMKALNTTAELAVLEAAHLSSVEAADAFAEALGRFCRTVDGGSGHG